MIWHFVKYSLQVLQLDLSMLLLIQNEFIVRWDNEWNSVLFQLEFRVDEKKLRQVFLIAGQVLKQRNSFCLFCFYQGVIIIDKWYRK